MTAALFGGDSAADDSTSAPGRWDGARTSKGETIPPGLARDLSEMARALQAEPDGHAVMQRVVAATVRDVPGATGAAITLLEHGAVSSPVHSDARAQAVSVAQEQFGEGPCVDSSRHEITVRCDDMRVERRWPRWAAAAVEQDVYSAMSFQLFVDGDTMGALDVFADAPNAFDADAENTALLLASHAAIAMADTRKLENLAVAVTTRDIIGQAKGILMERHKIDATRAFDLLVYASQHLNRKIRDIAVELAETGQLPTSRR